MNRFMSRLVFGFAIVGLMFIACLAYAYFIEPNRLVVNQTTLHIKNWNPAFNGFKIVMIGDIHGGSNNVTVEYMRRLVETANAQDADIIVLLGDYVSQVQGDHKALKMPVSIVADAMSGLHGKYGVFAVLGNHDGWFDDTQVSSELMRVGYKVLQNEVAVIDKDGHHLRLLGFKDHLELAPLWTTTSAQAKQFLAPTGDGDIIALEHSPDIMPMITGDLSISPDLKLILAAHTHGGQVWLPVFGTPVVPSSYGQRYSYGHVKENNVDMFVTSGVGTSVLPIRFMMPPEIAVLTIRSE